MTLPIAPYRGEAPTPPLRARDVVTPLGDAISAKAELEWQNWSTTLFGRARQIDEAQNGKGLFSGRGPMRRAAPTSPLLTKQQAQEQVERAGVDIPVTEGMRQAALDLRIKWAKEKQQLESTVARADQSFSTQFVLGATAFAVGAADPVNVATTFVPVVGEAKLAYWLAKGAARLGPTATKLAVRAGTGAYNGLIGSAAFEPINYAAHKAIGDDYDLVDSAISVGLGMGAGSALRALGGAGVDAYRGMRLRRDLTADAAGRVLDESLQQLGRGERADVAAAFGAEHGAAVVPNRRDDETKPFIASVSSLPKGTFMVIPVSENVEIIDTVGIKSVLRELHPVKKSATEEVYRKKIGDDVVVYTRTPDSNEEKEAFVVERLKPGDPGHAGALSEARAEDDPVASARARRLLYAKLPARVDRALHLAKEAKLKPIERKEHDEFSKFSPLEAGGHTVDAALGMAAHVAFGKHADVDQFLHRGQKLGADIPDGFVSTDYVPLVAELKPESERGISKGYEQARRYEENLGVNAVIFLHSTHGLHYRVNAANKRVIEAWDARDPNWLKKVQEAREAKKAERARRKAAQQLSAPGIQSEPFKPVLRSKTKVQKGNKKRRRQP